jgi:hypothetical protein
LRFDPNGSLFVLFRKSANKKEATGTKTRNWLDYAETQQIEGPWQVSFDPKWGGPAKPLTFEKLADWSRRPEEQIRFYSGTATYRTAFQCRQKTGPRTFLNLGQVEVMAEVLLNGRNLGVVWKPPFRVEITDALKAGENSLEIRAVNLWINRMIGDEQLSEDSDRNPSGNLKSWPAWLREGKPSPTGRYTFTSWRLWKRGDQLAESGLLGPVSVESAQ